MTALLSEPSPTTPDLESMTKSKLLSYAAENGVAGVSSAMRKADILAVIKNA